MEPSSSDLIGQIIRPSFPRSASPATFSPPVPLSAPVDSLPMLIGWMLGPPSPMPRQRQIVLEGLKIGESAPSALDLSGEAAAVA